MLIIISAFEHTYDFIIIPGILPRIYFAAICLKVNPIFIKICQLIWICAIRNIFLLAYVTVPHPSDAALIPITG